MKLLHRKEKQGMAIQNLSFSNINCSEKIACNRDSPSSGRDSPHLPFDKELTLQLEQRRQNHV
jgi:hypothetical protein